MSKENNKVDINKHEIDIGTLFKQNVNDLSAIKGLYRKLKEVEERISQIKYIDNTLAYKLKKEYEKLKKIILDENIQLKLSNDIKTINVKLNNDIEIINSQLDTKAKQIDLEVERKRIDSFTSLEEGSTTGDAELIDGRISLNGNIYTNIGGNIRNIDKKIHDNILSEKIINEFAYSTGEFVISNGDIYAQNGNTTTYYYGSTRSLYIEGKLELSSSTNQIFIGVEVEGDIFFGCNLTAPTLKKIENGKATTFTESKVDILNPFIEVKEVDLKINVNDNVITMLIDGNITQRYALPSNYNILGIAFLNFGLFKGKLKSFKTVNYVLENRFKKIEKKINEINNIDNDKNRFSTLTWNVLGDSFTARNKYQYYVQEVLGIGTVNSYGISGSCIANSSNPKNPMCIRYNDMSDNADIITVWGGVNDFGRSWGSNGGIPLGSFGDITNDTFYGALDVLIKGLVAKYPTSKIGFIIPTFVNDNDSTLIYKGGLQTNSLGYYLEDYRKAIREVCEKYSIPYLDLSKCGGLNQMNIKPLTEDGLHPNTDGFHFLKYKIAEFIKSL